MDGIETKVMEHLNTDLPLKNMDYVSTIEKAIELIRLRSVYFKRIVYILKIKK